MTIRIDCRDGIPDEFQGAVEAVRRSRSTVALTGAGISVESGIPDFRSRGGLWETYPPEEYATMEAFLSCPEKVWRFFRAMGRTLAGKGPNRAHTALADLEAWGFIRGVITQNVDSLHQVAGTRNIVEVHGHGRSLHCVRCGGKSPPPGGALDGEDVPRCGECGGAMKPDVVLFGEDVRGHREVEAMLEGCDLMLAIGTSGIVFPVAEIPYRVRLEGGEIIEFNISDTEITPIAVLHLLGPASATLGALADALRGE